MNPYLEHRSNWPDFHADFIVQLRTAISSQIGREHVVRIEVRIHLHERSAEERNFFGIADAVAAGERQLAPAASTTLLDAPIHLRLPAVEANKQRYLTILNVDKQRIVTVIELLSPSNKSRLDADDYLAKRREIIRSDANLVEIDLLRFGRRTLSPEMAACAYCVIVSRVVDRPQFAMWPIGLRDALPVIPIPLNHPDEPVRVDLKSVLDRSYDAAQYGKTIYGNDPQPPLSPEDDAWARGLAGLPI